MLIQKRGPNQVAQEKKENSKNLINNLTPNINNLPPSLLPRDQIVMERNAAKEKDLEVSTILTKVVGEKKREEIELH